MLGDLAHRRLWTNRNFGVRHHPADLGVNLSVRHGMSMPKRLTLSWEDEVMRASIIHRMPKGSSERISSLRKFLEVLRRQEDGSWRVLKHIWNYNEPGVTP